MLTNEERQAALHALNQATYKLEPPLHELEHALHPWVVFAIMPLFALASAGVVLGGGIADALANPVSLGIVAGLVVGKQLGITLFAWLAVKSGVSELPGGIGWRHVYGAGWLAGIGFSVLMVPSALIGSYNATASSPPAGACGEHSEQRCYRAARAMRIRIERMGFGGGLKPQPLLLGLIFFLTLGYVGRSRSAFPVLNQFSGLHPEARGQLADRGRVRSPLPGLELRDRVSGYPALVG